MESLRRQVFEQLLDAFDEPVLVANISQLDWPVVFCNPALEVTSGLSSSALKAQSLADIIEQITSREVALEASQAVRARRETSIPVQIDRSEFMLILKPLRTKLDAEAIYYAAFLRRTRGGVSGSKGSGDEIIHQALAKARHRIGDLSREDPISGLLNAKAFREVFAHDWAVAAREQCSLTLICFTLQDFDGYLTVFGRHAADTCFRRVSQTIKRYLRRASDVAARIDDDKVIVLSHATVETGAMEFAENIAEAIRELGIHHPRSSVGRFMTVRHKVAAQQANKELASSEKFIQEML